MSGANARLKVRRSGAYADSLRSYKIFVNDKQAGTIARNSAIELDVPSGRLKVQAKLDWCVSRSLMIEVAPGQTAELAVSNHWGALLSLWAVTFGAGSYLLLQEAPKTI
jgi:hypothetical protein